MDDRPAQRPEGALIERALKASRLSQRQAARRAGMSENRWRAIMHGHQSVGAGVTAPVRGPAETVARMAQVVGVTPKQLEDVGRSDAAEELREIARQAEPEHPASQADEIAGLIADIKRLAQRAQRLEAERRETDSAHRDEEAG